MRPTTRDIPAMAMALALAVVSLAAGARLSAQSGEQQIVAFFEAYDAAFTAKDLERLGTMYHPDVTVYEGGGINPGWADYRDRHLGPELRSFDNLEFGHQELKVNLIGPDAAYATANYSLGRRVDDQQVVSGGLATYVLIRQEGRWMIRHSHTSARRRPAGR